MSQMTPEDKIIYTFEDRPAEKRQVVYDDQQHSGLVLWMIVLGGVFVAFLLVLLAGYLGTGSIWGMFK